MQDPSLNPICCNDLMSTAAEGQALEKRIGDRSEIRDEREREREREREKFY